ncbi:MAG: ABC transporter permease subunit [Anaerolineae bacterium]|nr:ABC transporter permease subunit [Anaerolineae bacterium]
MNWRAIGAIIRKDLKVVSQSKAVIIPLIMVPLILLVAMPAAIGVFINGADLSTPDASDFTTMLEQMPRDLLDQYPEARTANHQVLLYVLLYFFAPFFLMLPLMVASVIAADSFAGEKERKTLEALIYTPTSDRTLYVAKVLSPWLAALAVTVVGLVAYAVVANVLAWPFMGRVFFPNAAWLVLTLWVSPAAAGMGLGTMVLVSSRVSTFQEAYQMGGMVVLPVLLLILGQVGGVIYFSTEFSLLVGLALWLIDLGLIWYGARTFRRGELLAKL